MAQPLVPAGDEPGRRALLLGAFALGDLGAGLRALLVMAACAAVLAVGAVADVVVVLVLRSRSCSWARPGHPRRRPASGRAYAVPVSAGA